MIKQFFDEQSSSFTYLVTSQEQKAFLVDPVLDNNKIYQDFISQHSLTLSFILETHTHADHVTGSGTLNDIYGCKIYCGLSSNSKNIETVICITIKVNSYDAKMFISCLIYQNDYNSEVLKSF